MPYALFDVCVPQKFMSFFVISTPACLAGEAVQRRPSPRSRPQPRSQWLPCTTHSPSAAQSLQFMVNTVLSPLTRLCLGLSYRHHPPTRCHAPSVELMTTLHPPRGRGPLCPSRRVDAVARPLGQVSCFPEPPPSPSALPPWHLFLSPIPSLPSASILRCGAVHDRGASVAVSPPSHCCAPRS
jgi:hypothetical protein